MTITLHVDVPVSKRRFGIRRMELCWSCSSQSPCVDVSGERCIKHLPWLAIRIRPRIGSPHPRIGSPHLLRLTVSIACGSTFEPVGIIDRSFVDAMCSLKNADLCGCRRMKCGKAVCTARTGELYSRSAQMRLAPSVELPARRRLDLRHPGDSAATRSWRRHRHPEHDEVSAAGRVIRHGVQ
eukprot:gene129-biopygen184